jgi:hypothetical protein
MIKLPVDIADKVGCTRDLIRKINRGARNPGFYLFMLIQEEMEKRGVTLKARDLYKPPKIAPSMEGALAEGRSH